MMRVEALNSHVVRSILVKYQAEICGLGSGFG